MPDIQTKTILLVEDEAIIALTETRQLQKEGYNVFHAFNGEKAVHWVRQNQPPVDLILMDIDLGSGIDGTEAARQILTTYDIPIVFLSSHTEKEIVAKTEEITSYGYVVKNSSPTVLFASIKMAFKLHEAHARLKDSEAKYRRLVEGAPDIIYTFSSNRGGIYYSSPITAALGYSLDYLYAHPFLWNELTHPDDRVQINAAIQEFEVGKPFDIQYRIKNSKGDWIWLRDRSIGRQVIGDEILIEGLATDITESRLAEETLRIGEKRYRDLFENAPIAIFQSSLEGKIYAVNPLFTSMFGYSSLEDMRTTLEDNANGIFVDPHRRAEIVRIRLANPELKEFVSLYRRKDNSTFYGRLKVRSILDTSDQVISFEGYIEYISEGSQPPQILATNQTSQSMEDDDLEKPYQARIQQLQAKIDQLKLINHEHILAKKDLQEMAECFKNLFDHAPDAIFLADPATRIILDANKVACRLLGKQLDEIRGMQQSQLHPPDVEGFSEVSFDQHVGESQAQGFTHPFENKLLLADGSLMPVEIVAQLIHMQNSSVLMGTFRDITKRKGFESKLLQSERHALALFENSPIGLLEEDLSRVKTRFEELSAIGVKDMRGYLDENPSEIKELAACIKILSINQAGIDLLGSSSKDEFTRELTNFLTPKSWEILKEQMIALAEGQTHFADDIPILTISGQVRVFGLNVTVMPGFETSLARVMVSIIDMSDRKLAEDKINSLLREKELLLKEVHHRIKNNMSSISSLLHLQMEAVKTPSAQMALQDAEGRVRSMMVLYDKLYNSSNYNSVSMNDYLPTLLHEIVGLFQSKIPIKIETHIEDIILPARLLTPLGIILNEMTTNAIKHAFPERSNGKISLTSTHSSNHISILFQDNGIGLPKTASLKGAKGFGMQLIGMLINQINGNLTIQREIGTAYLIEFDLY